MLPLGTPCAKGMDASVLSYTFRVLIKNIALRKHLAENELTEMVYHERRQYRLN